TQHDGAVVGDGDVVQRQGLSHLGYLQRSGGFAVAGSATSPRARPPPRDTSPPDTAASLPPHAVAPFECPRGTSRPVPSASSSTSTRVPGGIARSTSGGRWIAPSRPTTA